MFTQVSHSTTAGPVKQLFPPEQQVPSELTQVHKSYSCARPALNLSTVTERFDHSHQITNLDSQDNAMHSFRHTCLACATVLAFLKGKRHAHELLFWRRIS